MFKEGITYSSFNGTAAQEDVSAQDRARQLFGDLPGRGRAPQASGGLLDGDRALHGDLLQGDRAVHGDLLQGDRALHGDLLQGDRALHDDLPPRDRALHDDP